MECDSPSVLEVMQSFPWLLDSEFLGVPVQPPGMYHSYGDPNAAYSKESKATFTWHDPILHVQALFGDGIEPIRISRSLALCTTARFK
eukprot:scaffold22740_cov139-Cylindrotheca_fusiformis.AAC.19